MSNLRIYFKLLLVLFCCLGWSQANATSPPVPPSPDAPIELFKIEDLGIFKLEDGRRAFRVRLTGFIEPTYAVCSTDDYWDFAMILRTKIQIAQYETLMAALANGWYVTIYPFDDACVDGISKIITISVKPDNSE